MTGNAEGYVAIQIIYDAFIARYDTGVGSAGVMLLLGALLLLYASMIAAACISCCTLQ